MILFGKPTDWANAKKVLSETNFLQQIKQYNKDSVPQSAITKIKKFVENPGTVLALKVFCVIMLP